MDEQAGATLTLALTPTQVIDESGNYTDIMGLTLTLTLTPTQVIDETGNYSDITFAHTVITDTTDVLVATNHTRIESGLVDRVVDVKMEWVRVKVAG